MSKLKDTNSVYEKCSGQYLLVRIGNEQYGFDIHDVSNIIRIRPIIRIPNAQPHLKGMINLRGEIVAVMSFLLEETLSEDARIVILNLKGYGKIGIIVNQVYGMTKEEVTLFDIQTVVCEQNIFEQEGMHEEFYIRRSQ